MFKITRIYNIPIGRRLGLGFGLIIVIFLVMGLTLFYGLQTISTNMHNLTHISIPSLETLASLNVQRMIIRADTLEVLLTENEEYTPSLLADIMASRHRSWELVDEAWEEFLAIPRLSEEERELVKRLTREYEAWRLIYTDLDRTMEQLSLSVDEERREMLYQEYRDLVESMIPISDTMGSTFEETTRLNRELTHIQIEEDLSMASVLNIASLLALFLGVLVAIILSIVITNSVKIPVMTGVNLLSRISKGDLTEEISSTLSNREDEMGHLARALEKMIENLTRQITDIAEVSSNLGSFSGEIAASVSQVTSSAQETASSVLETTATVEEVKQTADATSKKAREVAENAREGLQLAHTGETTTESMTQGMEGISGQMTAIADTIMKLSEQSQMIGEIIQTVDDISEQSNLLAVNAAVEAAKAGEHGRGFAVVAQEIKNLAQQSKQATKQVRRILQEIQGATGSAVMATEQGSRAVEEGVEEANKTRKSIKALNTRFSEAVQSAAQIAAANKEHLLGMDQVAQAMDTIKEASNQNVESMKELESAALTLKEMGHRLTQLMKQYKV